MANTGKIGIIGGNGALGSAIGHGLVKGGAVAPDRLWISSRSGAAGSLAGTGGIHVTALNQELVDACDIVFLSVPPQQVDELNINAGDRLVISVMAGVRLERLARLTGAARLVRAMSSPAAGIGLAYSPFFAGTGVSQAERESVRDLFAACGETDEVAGEDQIDHFTALTGPVPGFVAFFADCMARYAQESGIDPDIASRAVCQLFLASGTILAESGVPPRRHVDEMIDYAGTTAAGLEVMQASKIAELVASGLDASRQRARALGEE